jgi:hypothetical protein
MPIQMLDAHTLILAATAADLVLVAVLGWLVARSGRLRDRAIEAQRATLERLRTDLAALVSDAEQRAQALEETLGAREQRLRALLAEIGRIETGARPAPRAQERVQERVPDRASAPSAVTAVVRESARVARRLAGDPAEARLLRDLEVRLPHVPPR